MSDDEQRLGTSLSTRRTLIKAIREFLEDASNRKEWTARKLAIEMWDLTPKVQQEFRTWELFWEDRGKTIEHVCRGRYDKEGDSTLYAGFDAFAKKHVSAYTERLRHLERPGLLEVAAMLDTFFPATETPFAWGDFSSSPHHANTTGVRVLQVRRIDHSEKNQLGNWISSYLAYRPLIGSEAQYMAAVWFSHSDATIRCEGFILPARGLVVMRWPSDPTKHLLGSLSRYRGERSEIPAYAQMEALGRVSQMNIACQILSDVRHGNVRTLGYYTTHSFIMHRASDYNLFPIAERLLNSLDNPYTKG